jgi:hypothetical protein
MNRVPFVSGKERRDAVRSTCGVETTTAKVDSALTFRDEAVKLRRRLLELIVENEQKRRSQTTNNQV